MKYITDELTGQIMVELTPEEQKIKADKCKEDLDNLERLGHLLIIEGFIDKYSPIRRFWWGLFSNDNYKDDLNHFIHAVKSEAIRESNK